MSETDPVLDGREGASRAMAPARDLVKLVKAGGKFKPCRAVLVGTAGDLNVVMASGKTQSAVPFQAGMNAIRIEELLAGGTGDDVWAVY